MRNTSTEQINATIDDGTVIRATVVTARGRKLRASLAAHVAAVCRTNRKWSSVYNGALIPLAMTFVAH